MSLKQRNVLFLDLQTMGAKPGSAHILEIAWSSHRLGRIESHLVRQPNSASIPRRIELITGICDEDLKEAKALPEILGSLNEFLTQEFTEEVLAIIHFAQFEKPFLTDAFAQLQRPLPFSIQCTHEIAKRLMPNLPTRGIKGLAGYFGFPSGELKRAANHVQATQIIWQGLTTSLAERNITSLNDLREWLEANPKAARVKYEYPLPKEKRLSLPKQPGVYRMMSKWGEVLYVGKATSLHDRVNSYFRGQRNRDARKLEMLTQVWDIQVTPVGSALEAALLETDEIKRLDPPYNISLKTGRRTMTFFNRDFTSIRQHYDEQHWIGPFSNPLVFDSMLKLSLSLQSGEFDENLFFDRLDKDLIKAGFQIFCFEHNLDPVSFRSLRSILAVGLNWLRKQKPGDEPVAEIHEDADDDAEVSLTDPLQLGTELTPQDIADKFERHFLRAAKAYLRAKKLHDLLNSDICLEFKGNSKIERLLKVRQGQIIKNEDSNVLVSKSWQDLSIDTYDRMTVLLTELEKLRSEAICLRIQKIILGTEPFSL